MTTKYWVNKSEDTLISMCIRFLFSFWWIDKTRGPEGPEASLKDIYYIYIPYLYFRETHFHSVTTQTQAVVTICYHCIIFLLPFNGNSMCYGYFAFKMTENVLILRYNFSLSDCHFLIFQEGEVTSPYCQGPAWTLIYLAALLPKIIFRYSRVRIMY